MVQWPGRRRAGSEVAEESEACLQPRPQCLIHQSQAQQVTKRNAYGATLRSVTGLVEPGPRQTRYPPPAWSRTPASAPELPGRRAQIGGAILRLQPALEDGMRAVHTACQPNVGVELEPPFFTMSSDRSPC